MEKEDAPFSISEDDFLNLVRLAQQDDLGAILRLIDLFDQLTYSDYMLFCRAFQELNFFEFEEKDIQVQTGKNPCYTYECLDYL